MVKNLPANALGWEDPLEKEMATHSNILAWGISWTEEPGRLQSMRLYKSWTQLRDKQQYLSHGADGKMKAGDASV